ncbi:hypothetical protein C0W65_21525 [Bacillus subtilis]|nr:hypothetical protein C0W65_21525 [Bacillus subtilis]
MLKRSSLNTNKKESKQDQKTAVSDITQLSFFCAQNSKHFPSVAYKTIPLGKNKKDYEMEGF